MTATLQKASAQALNRFINTGFARQTDNGGRAINAISRLAQEVGIGLPQSLGVDAFQPNRFDLRDVEQFARHAASGEECDERLQISLLPAKVIERHGPYWFYVADAKPLADAARARRRRDTTVDLEPILGLTVDGAGNPIELQIKTGLGG